jgi:hypothetical protein
VCTSSEANGRVAEPSPAANRYFGVDQTVSYGNTTIMSLSAGIVDTVRVSSPPPARRS